MINWLALAPQVQALAQHAALRLAQAGIIPWTGELARAHNRRWLKENAPGRLEKSAGLAEEGQCECGGVCLVFAADENGVYHVCQGCSAQYRVAWSDYARSAGAAAGAEVR